MSVKAILFEGADRPLVVGETPRRNLAPDEVRLDIAACGICGSDLHMAHAPETFGITEGAVLGHEFAGTIVSIPSSETSISNFSVGDRIGVPGRAFNPCGSCFECVDEQSPDSDPAGY